MAREEAHYKYDFALDKDREAKSRNEDDVDAYVAPHAAAFAEYCDTKFAYDKARDRTEEMFRYAVYRAKRQRTHWFREAKEEGK